MKFSQIWQLSSKNENLTDFKKYTDRLISDVNRQSRLAIYEGRRTKQMFFTTSHTRFILIAKINGIGCTIEAVFKDSFPTEGTVFSRNVISTCITATYTTFPPPILPQKHIVFVTKCFQIFNYKLPQVPLIRYLWQFIEHFPVLTPYLYAYVYD